MKCKHCEKEFIPKQLFCSAKCRIYDKRGVTKPLQVTDSLQEVTQSLQEEKEYKIGCKLHGIKNCELGLCK